MSDETSRDANPADRRGEPVGPRTESVSAENSWTAVLGATEEVGGEGPVRGGSDRRSLWNRLVAVLKRSPGAFADIAGDRSATDQALVVLVATTVFPSVLRLVQHELGYTVGIYAVPESVPWVSSPAVIEAISLATALIYVAIMAASLKLVSGWFHKESATYGGWFRSLGFISITSVLEPVPWVGWIIALGYYLVLTVAAIRELTQVRTMRAIGMLLVAWLAVWVTTGVIAAIIGMMGLGIASYLKLAT